MGASSSKPSDSSEQISAVAAALAQPSNGAGEGAATAEQDTRLPLPESVEEVFRNKFATLFEFKVEPPVLEDAPELEADDSAAAVSSGKAEEDEDVSVACAAAADASAAATETPAWLNFTPTPIRDDITPEIIKRILSLSHTNHFFREQSEPYINMLAEQLVAIILIGREEKAKALIKACPFLLERRATVTCPVGRLYKDVTAYEAALYAGDTQMCDMMAPFLKTKMNNEQRWIDTQIELGRNGFEPGMRARDIRLEQCHNVFPGGNVQAVVDAQQAYDFNSLIEAINQASPEDIQAQLEHKITQTPLGRAISLFRSDFTALSKQEQHANLEHLLKALELYANDKRITEWWDTRHCDKLDVFWRQVIGFVQLFLPECDKQVFHQGLVYVVERKERLEREVDFKKDRGYSLHLQQASSGCGFDFAGAGWECAWESRISKRRRATHGRPPPYAGPLGGHEDRLVGKLMSNKNIKLENLCSRRQALRNHP